jgi:hypothetical protein
VKKKERKRENILHFCRKYQNSAIFALFFLTKAVLHNILTLVVFWLSIAFGALVPEKYPAFHEFGRSFYA